MVVRKWEMKREEIQMSNVQTKREEVVVNSASFKMEPKTVKKRSESKSVRRGEVFIADMGQGLGSEQSGFRPVLILQNDCGNKYSSTTIVAMITSKMSKANMPTHVEVGVHDGFEKQSMIMLEQIRTIDKARLKQQVTCLKQGKMKAVERAMRISLGLE